MFYDMVDVISAPEDTSWGTENEAAKNMGTLTM